VRADMFAALALALVVSTLFVADGRTEWRKFIDSDEVPSDLRGLVSDAGQVYWEHGVSLLWIKLHKTSYYSCLQGSGAMFFAGTASEFQRRRDGLALLNPAGFSIDTCAIKAESAGNTLSRTQLAAVCHRLPELDALILLKDVDGVPHVEWLTPVPVPVIDASGHTHYANSFYKYRCASLVPEARIEKR